MTHPKVEIERNFEATPGDFKNTNGGYSPTEAERSGIQHVDKRFQADSKYWEDVHDTQMRLYAKYRNARIRNRGTGYSNIQIAQPYYVADVIASFMIGALLRTYPYAKVTNQGDEDFVGKQIIDRVHGWQHQQPYVKQPTASAVRDSVITGTGVLIPSWSYEENPFLERIPKTVSLVNPADPFGAPIEQPTGEIDLVESTIVDDHIKMQSIPPWNVFPQAGASGDIDNAHHVTYKIRMSKHHLLNWQKAGFIDNVQFISDAAFGSFVTDSTIDDTDVMKAKKEDNARIWDKDSIEVLIYWGLYPFYNFRENLEDGDEIRPDEVECIIIKPLNSDVILKLERNPYQCQKKPCILFPYDKLEDELFGMGPLWMAEKLFQHNEDMFNMTQDAANREIYSSLYYSDAMDSSQLKQRNVDKLVAVPDALMKERAWPQQAPPNQHILPNIMNQRASTENLIYEVTAAIDMIRGISQQEQSATKTNINWRAINMRFGVRMEFMEDNGLNKLMQWNMVLNHQFLDDQTVFLLTGAPPSENPFNLILPTIPITSLDFKFEGSQKAAENPIKAQLIRGIIPLAAMMPPGIDENGNHTIPNMTALFRELLKNLDVTDDLSKFFTTITPEDAQQRTNLSLQGQVGSGQADGQETGSLGALTEGNLGAGMLQPGGGDSTVRQKGLS